MDAKQKIREFISRSIPGHTLSDGEDMFASGFVNSMFALQLVQFVEVTFEIAIDSDDLDLDNFRSVDALSRLVERKRAA